MRIQIAPEKGNDAEALREAVAPLVEGLREEIATLRQEVRSLRGQRDPDRLLNLDEAADLLGVSRRTVDTLVADGELPSLKVRRCRRIPRQSLRAYIRSRAGEGRHA